MPFDDLLAELVRRRLFHAAAGIVCDLAMELRIAEHMEASEDPIVAPVGSDSWRNRCERLQCVTGRDSVTVIVEAARCPGWQRRLGLKISEIWYETVGAGHMPDARQVLPAAVAEVL